MLNFSKQITDYKSGDLIIAHFINRMAVLKIEKVNKKDKIATVQLYRGKIRKTTLKGTSVVGTWQIPFQAILRMASKEEITKAEKENRLK